MERVYNLEALRGVLAVFVISVHMFLISGLTPDSLGPLHGLVMLHAPVDVFIILSGFVIFFLLENRQEPFHLYITRRVFRIFPAYLVCLAIFIPLMGLSLGAVHALAWRTDFVQGEIGALSASLQQFVPHLLTHLTLTNGMFGQWLPYSAFSFLGPAWSLSLEWQFYLVAPIIWACFNTRNRFVVALTLLVLSLAHWKFRFGEYMGFLPQKLPFFIIGILSFYVFKYRGQSISKSAHWQAWALLTAFSVWVAKQSGVEGLAIWFAIYAFSYRNVAILEVPVLNYLGQISYSLYISHMILVYVGLLILNGLHIPALSHDSWLYFGALYIVSMPMIFGFSHVLHHQVEKPFMALAKRVCTSMAPVVPRLKEQP